MHILWRQGCSSAHPATHTRAIPIATSTRPHPPPPPPTLQQAPAGSAIDSRTHRFIQWNVRYGQPPPSPACGPNPLDIAIAQWPEARLHPPQIFSSTRQVGGRKRQLPDRFIATPKPPGIERPWARIAYQRISSRSFPRRPEMARKELSLTCFFGPAPFSPTIPKPFSAHEHVKSTPSKRHRVLRQKNDLRTPRCHLPVLAPGWRRGRRVTCVTPILYWASKLFHLRAHRDRIW